MKKKVQKVVKMQFIGGQAKPGAELASVGVNMVSFCKAFNDASKNRLDEVVPTVITVYVDKTFDFEFKAMPVANMLLKQLKIEKGSGKPSKEIAGKVSADILKKVAQEKLVDFNTDDINKAVRIVAGTAKSMGLELDEDTINLLK